MPTESKVTTLFLEFSRSKLVEEFWSRLRSTVESLNEEQVWWRPNAASNSIGNLLLHLNGNVRQWLLTSFAKIENTRDRSAEFMQRDRIPVSVLLERLGQTMQQVSELLARLTESDLLTVLEIQGDTTTGLEAVYHVVEHFGMHYGQILYITKMLRGEDLGFYRELDKN